MSVHEPPVGKATPEDRQAWSEASVRPRTMGPLTRCALDLASPEVAERRLDAGKLPARALARRLDSDRVARRAQCPHPLLFVVSDRELYRKLALLTEEGED
jgi:hypothetical protein